MSRRFIAWGSYDKSKPRVRLLLDELRSRHLLRAEINMAVWASVRDKAVIGRAGLLKAMLRLVVAYPRALLALSQQPPGSAILLPYPAIPDIFLAWPIARLRRHLIIFDAFISPYDTVVSDRALARAGGLVSKLIWVGERLALKLADVILADTDPHADFFSTEFGIPRHRFQTVLVGAEQIFWDARNAPRPTLDDPSVPADRPLILFFGQLIPLHGIGTILEAVSATRDEPFHWLIIGSGQEEPRVRGFLAGYDGDNVHWVPWVDYDRIPAYISAASVALGIFGTSDKAGRVVPNKAYQIMAVGTPLITRSSPAMDSVARHCRQAVITVPAGDAQALAAAVREAVSRDWEWKPVPLATAASLGPARGVEALSARMQGKPGKERDSTEIT